MLPRLQAQESLATVNRVALGTGSLERRAAARLQREWAATARGETPRRQLARPEALPGMGIGYRMVERKAAP